MHVKEKHKGIKFPCSECEYIGIRKYSLKLHFERWHSDFKSVKCDECDFVAVGNFKLKEHVSVHFQFQCDMCPYRSKLKDSLKYHKMEKHERKEYKCEICGMILLSGRAFGRHMKFKHKL